MRFLDNPMGALRVLGEGGRVRDHTHRRLLRASPGRTLAEGDDPNPEPDEVDPCEGVQCCQLLEEIDGLHGEVATLSNGIAELRREREALCGRGTLNLLSAAKCTIYQVKEKLLSDRLADAMELALEKMALADECHCYAEPCNG